MTATTPTARPVRPRVVPLPPWVPPTGLLVARALPFLGPVLLVAVAAGAFSELPTASDRLDANIPPVVGNGALFTLAMSMAVTPVHTVTGWTWHRPLRRYFGLWAFAFALMEGVHTVTTSGGAWFDGLFGQVFLAAATVATLLLVPLVVTSNRWSMRKLGRRWKQLHKLVYLALPLIAVHLVLLPDATEETIIFGVLFVPGLVLRIPVVRRAVIERRRRAAVSRRAA
jgi:sulfoxide reductase heme-binding subunit YedZ